MSRSVNTLLLLTALVLGLARCNCVLAAEPEAGHKGPNIVYFLADDLGWGDVGWHDSEIPTPNLDKLANKGAKLESFYVQSVCSPTRAAFMTGRYPMRYGLQSGVIRPWAQYGLPLEEQILPQALQRAGYATAITGKWHLGHFERTYLPTARGFDHQYGHYNGAIDYFAHTRDGGLDWHRNDKGLQEEGYSTHLLTREAIAIVNEYSGKKPFFLYVPYNAVHSPHQVPDKYLNQFPNLKGDRKLYAGMLTALDESVGLIVDAIEKAGATNNTLFLFSSDNGGPQPGKVTSNGPLRAGKGTFYEGGVRVPAFATWQGVIPAGSTVNEPIHITDLYPTLLKIAQAETEQRLPLDGTDVWEAIVRQKALPERDILINVTPAAGAIRRGKWKLVQRGGRSTDGFDGEPIQESTAQPATGSGIELFDLSTDPNEASNVAEANREIAADLLKKLEEYRKQSVPPKVKPKGKEFRSPSVWGEP